jgi:hypothetical protein
VLRPDESRPGRGRLHHRADEQPAQELVHHYGHPQHLLAVDEMKWFLGQNFGVGDEIGKDDNGKRRLLQDMMNVLNGRTGSLVFSDLAFGAHTELWDVDHMHQRDISTAVFNAAKVLFWDVMITAGA